jgi:N-dimethylarginine dimethylaminohydrolase
MPPTFLMTDPAHFDVHYQINPWMRPDAWAADPAASRAAAAAASATLAGAIRATGAKIEIVPAVEGLPDLVFPANGGVVLDGRVLVARFLHPERRGEEPVFRAAFEALRERGIVEEVHELPDGVFHEGAGDAIWDTDRGYFWCGYGQRSSREAIATIARVFGQDTVALELATPRFYHLDTCFCPLSGGNVLYYPQAFTAASLAEIRARIPAAQRIEATDEDAAAFCVNAVNLGSTIIMARAPAPLKRKLEARGYRVVEVDLSPFILSGGAAYCMTLRLDRTSGEGRVLRAAE